MEKEIELLSRITVNHLFLAQFEAFRASLLSLKKRKPELALAILQAIVSQGGRFNGVLWSSTCTSSSHLTWLSTLELLHFEKPSSIWNLDPETLKLKVEFLLLLQFITCRVSESIAKFPDLESIGNQDLSGVENYDLQVEGFTASEEADSNDSSSNLLVDSIGFLDRITELGYRRLKEAVFDDVVENGAGADPFTEGELKCLRRICCDQNDLFDALCCNIQKQLQWCDPYDSRLAISLRESEESSLSLLEDPGGVDAGRGAPGESFHWGARIQQEVQLSHLDYLKECLRDGDEDLALSHIRFLHGDYGLADTEYR